MSGVDSDAKSALTVESPAGRSDGWSVWHETGSITFESSDIIAGCRFALGELSVVRTRFIRYRFALSEFGLRATNFKRRRRK